MMLKDVIVQVPVNKRSPQRRQKAERFQDADFRKVGADRSGSQAGVPEPNSLKLLVPLLGLLAGVGVLQTLPLFKR